MLDGFAGKVDKYDPRFITQAKITARLFLYSDVTWAS